MREGHPPVIRRNKSCVAGAEEAQVGDPNIRQMAVGRPVVLLRWVQMRDDEKRPANTSGIPGIYIAVLVSACNGGMIGRDGDRGDRARFDSWGMSVTTAHREGPESQPFVPGPIIILMFWL